jgi:hypothetical protein
MGSDYVASGFRCGAGVRLPIQGAQAARCDCRRVVGVPDTVALNPDVPQSRVSPDPCSCFANRAALPAVLGVPGIDRHGR